MIIFAIDDDTEDLELFQETIVSIDPSIQCIIATDWFEALAVLECVSPDVLFLDINMPKVNGFQCLQHLNAAEHLKHIPVVLFSSALDPGYEQLLNSSNRKFLCKEALFKNSVDSIKSVLFELKVLAVEASPVMPLTDAPA